MRVLAAIALAVSIFLIALFVVDRLQSNKHEVVSVLNGKILTPEELKLEKVLKLYEGPHQTHSPSEKIEINTHRDRKVLLNLLRFVERTASISAKSISSERERVKHSLLAQKQKPSEVPKIQIIKDEAGYEWEQMRYEGGAVRYFPRSNQELR